MPFESDTLPLRDPIRRGRKLTPSTPVDAIVQSESHASVASPSDAIVAKKSPNPIAAAFYGYPDTVIAQVVCCSLPTARCFKYGMRKPGKTAFKLWSLYISGRILGDVWQGWRAADGELFDPEGNRTTQSQLRAYAHVWALARELARGDVHATAELDRISNMAMARIERRRRADRSSERSSSDGRTPEGGTASDPLTSVHPLPNQPEFSSASDVPNGSAQPRLGGSE